MSRHRVWIRIDETEHEVPEGRNLLEACLSLGLDLPYFCWHPALGSVGACRQCAVKQFRDEHDTHGRIVMACMTPTHEGLIASIRDPEAVGFRASVIEWLMVNHPHDCPVCDEGGECHLQDMTVMTGHAYRKYRFPKRTYRNQDLGPFVNHEMNRCITCYRCVRFYREYAGGKDLSAFAAHDHVYFGRQKDGALESVFSGNLVEVCPTGVFTDKTLKRHFARKWDLQNAPSVCAHCSLGCNTFGGERYGTLRGIRNRYHSEINGYFLCDRGRYGYEFVNSERRVRDFWFRESPNGPIAKVPRGSEGTYLEKLGSWISEAKGRTIGIGSPRASLEANFALQALVGRDRFHAGVSAREFGMIGAALGILSKGPVRSASLADVERADAAVVLGEDVAGTAPRLALSLRQSIRNAPKAVALRLKIPAWQDASIRDVAQEARGPLFVATTYRTEIDEIASGALQGGPDEIARWGYALAHALDPEAPSVPDLSTQGRAWVEEAAAALGAAASPVIVSGMGSGSEAVIRAAANVALALHRRDPAVRLALVFSEANSLGLGMLGGRSLEEAFQAVESGAAEQVIVLENDLFRRAPESEVTDFLERVRGVILLDHTATAMLPRADAILPTATFAEDTGTWINHEGRAQRFFSVFKPDPRFSESRTREAWRWLRDLRVSVGEAMPGSWETHDDLLASIAEIEPKLAGVLNAAPPGTFRVLATGGKVPRESHRYSGRTAIWASRSIEEPKPLDDPDSPFSFSMEGPVNGEGAPLPAELLPRYRSPGWNSVQALNKFQREVGGELRGGPTGARLLEPSVSAQVEYFRAIPPPTASRPDTWLVVPVHHVFGSEELSLLSPAIAERAPRPSVSIHPTDASRVGVSEGETLTLHNESGGEEREWSLPARLDERMPPGVLGVPAGLPGIAGFDSVLPAVMALSGRRMRGAA